MFCSKTSYKKIEQIQKRGLNLRCKTDSIQGASHVPGRAANS